MTNEATSLNGTRREALVRFLRHQERSWLAEYAGDEYLDLRVAVGELSADPLSLEEEPPDDGSATEAGRSSAQLGSRLRLPGQQTFLVGGSGAGKTVTLARLALGLGRAAAGALEERETAALIPVWLPAASLPGSVVASPLDLVAGVLESGGVFSGARELVAMLLEQGRLVLLVDGLQEVPLGDPERRRNLRRLVDLPGLSLVATARPGYELPGAGAGATVLRLHGFDAAERRQLLDLKGVARPEAEELQRLALRSRLARAVEVPQLWQMAVRLAGQPEGLRELTSPARLYESFVRDTLRRREESLERGEGPGYPAEELLPVLELLAASVVLQGKTALSEAEAAELVERWAACTGRRRGLPYASNWPRDVLDHLPRFYQPVVRAVPGGSGLGFAHGSLSDFLAARWLLGVRPAAPRQLLGLPHFAPLLAFLFDLLEQQSPQEALPALDAERLRHGSPHLVAPWLRQVARERLTTCRAELCARFEHSLARPWELAQLGSALRRRGPAWAGWLLRPLTERLGAEAVAPLKDLLEGEASRSRLQRVREQQREKQLAREREKNLHAGRKRRQRGSPEHLERLLARLKEAEGAYDQSRVLEGIAACGVQGDGASVVPFVKSEDSYVRRAAAEALGALGDPDAREAARSLLKDRDPYVRSAGARAVGKLGDADSVELLRCSLTDSNHYVLSASCIALGVLGDAEDGPRLAALLSHENPFVRGAALRGLGFLGASDQAAAVRRHLDPRHEPDAKNRSAAAKAAGFLQDR